MELQEVERWLLQMSSRLVTADSMHSGSLEAATQQLARHKVSLAQWKLLDYLLLNDMFTNVLHIVVCMVL